MGESTKIMSESTKKGKKKFKMIHSFALLFFIIIFAAILTYIIPAGQFDRVEGINGRMQVIPGSFKYVESSPATLFDIFLAVPNGIVAAASMVVCTLIIGGGIEVIQETGSLNIGISKAISKLNKKSSNLVLVFLFYVFAILGGFMGFAEAAIPFYPIAVSIAIGLGYDSLTGVSVALIGSLVGFAAGPTNQSSVGIPHAIAGLPMFSGLGLRVILFFVFTGVGLHHILRYTKKIRNNPDLSIMKDIDTSDLSFDIEKFNREKFTLAHCIILLSLIGGLVLFVYKALYTDWYLNELSAVFVVIAVIAGICGRLGINKTAEAFLKGASDICVGALIIGIAMGIQYVLNIGNIIDTIVNSISTPLISLPPFVSAIGMLVVICILNFLIPSGSGKAIVTMPILLPMADLIGITKQTTILAYQLGDGITNIVCPTLGLIFIALAFGKVPFDRWIKFTLPLCFKLMVISIVFLFVAVQINYGPF